MSVGSVVSTVVFSLSSLFATLLVFWYYTKVSAKNIPVLCCIFTIISIYVSILPFPLLVVDISAALDVRADPGLPKETWMIGVWYAIVAATYIMGWAVLPVSQSYTEVGGFSRRQKFISAVKTNLKLYAICLVVLVVIFGYVVFLKGAYNSVSNILKLAISLANAWGLILLVLFMSSGLVGVPKMLWRNSDAVRMLHRCYFAAVDIQEDLDIAAMELAEIKAELMTIHPLVAEEHKSCWSQMMEMIVNADRDIPHYHFASARVKPVTGGNHTDVSLKHLEGLHERVKYSIKIALRMNHLWGSTIGNCVFYDHLIRGVNTTNNPVKRIWFTIRGIVFKGVAACATVLTILVLWSELVLPFQSLTTKQLSIIALVVDSKFELIGSMIFMFYMAYCSYWAILQLRVFDVYVMLPGISDNSSLCFSATFLTRLIMPLCFNFLLISDLVSSNTDVMYGHVYRRNMDVSMVFGSWLNQYLPLFIPVVSALVLAKLVDRLLVVVGVGVHSPDDLMSDTVRERIEDGRRLVEHAIGQPLTALNPNTSAVFSGGTSEPSRDTAGGQARPAEHGWRYREYLERRRAANEREPV